MTLQEWKTWIILLHMTPPVEVQGQTVAGAVQGVDLQAVDGSFPSCLFGNGCLSKQCELRQGHPGRPPCGTVLLTVAETASTHCLQCKPPGLSPPVYLLSQFLPHGLD